MLVDPDILHRHCTGDLVAQVRGKTPGYRRLGVGLYEIHHFSFDNIISKRGGNLHERDGDEWGYDGRMDCGVCDSVEQFMEDCGSRLQEDKAEYCVSFTTIRKADEPGSGGWRWHKWGPYIGRQEPTTEYLADEPLIEQIVVYHIFRKRAVPSEAQLFVLQRDGAFVRRGTEQELWDWIHDHHGYSVHRALTHEGYTITPVEGV